MRKFQCWDLHILYSRSATSDRLPVFSLHPFPFPYFTLFFSWPIRHISIFSDGRLSCLVIFFYASISGCEGTQNDVDRREHPLPTSGLAIAFLSL